MILWELFITFFKIGAFTFGGGYAMIPLIQSEVVSNGWLTEAQITDFIAVSESTPGPLAVNMSTYVGAEIAGFAGALCATLGVVMPSFIIILIVAKSYELFKSNKYVKNAMTGIKPAVIGLIAAAFLSVAVTVFLPDGFCGISDALRAPELYITLGIFASMTFAAFKKLHPILIIVISAAIGISTGFIFGL